MYKWAFSPLNFQSLLQGKTGPLHFVGHCADCNCFPVVDNSPAVVGGCFVTAVVADLVEVDQYHWVPALGKHFLRDHVWHIPLES